MKNYYDVIIVGTGPAGLGAAFYVAENSKFSILMIDKSKICSGGLLNDCKQNYTYPVGFPQDLWDKEEAENLLKIVKSYLQPTIIIPKNISIYRKRAEKIGVQLLEIQQYHVGTDKSPELISKLINKLKTLNVEIYMETEMIGLDYENKEIFIKNIHSQDINRIKFNYLILAPGRAGFKWLQEIMKSLNIKYTDNIVDIGVRIEAKEINYPIVSDYYDPKIIFPDGVRTFCTNSGAAYVVKEKYDDYYSVNGHSLSNSKRKNHLVNFAMLKTIKLTDPVVSGHEFARILGIMAMQLSGGNPMMQRIGDFRMGKRSKASTFNEDLYDFEPTLKTATPGDVSLAIPAKILRDIWKSLKMLDTIVPGILHPSSIIYYPEIKTYANRPQFINKNFLVKESIYMIGDGAGTSRGITAAWASGIKTAMDIVKK